MAVLSILPVLGAAIVWGPAAIFLALEGDWGKALILTAWGGIVVALIDNLLYPMLIKNRMQLHAVPVFIAVLGGLIVFGAVGIVLGPVVLVIAVGLLEIWRRRVAAEDGARSRAEVSSRCCKTVRRSREGGSPENPLAKNQTLLDFRLRGNDENRAAIADHEEADRRY